MRIDPTNQPLQSHMPTADDEIDLLQAVGALYRYWGWIAGSGALGLILAGVNLLNTKPVYQGEFQIVLSKESSKGGALAMLSENPALASIAGLGVASGNDSIATEVQILNSPSVLKPVFDAGRPAKLKQLPTQCVFGTGPIPRSQSKRKRAPLYLTSSFATLIKIWCCPLQK